jgi:uncharacterized protein (DUF433 family)
MNAIATNPQMMHGTPCFAGTRVPVKILFEYLDGGYNVDYFLMQFPTVNREQVAAVLQWSASAAVDPRLGPHDEPCVSIGVPNEHLLIFPPTRMADDWVTFRCRVEMAGIIAVANVHHLGFSPASFFTDLEDNWRGWEGERSWVAMEHQLLLNATIDPTGHIHLLVTLRDDPGPGGWTLRVPITVESGEQLSAIARELRVLFPDRTR